jgi:hypothetical protein
MLISGRAGIGLRRSLEAGIGRVLDTLLEGRLAPGAFSARIRMQDGHGAFVLRSGDLTGYDCDTLADDALRAGPDALLEVEISPPTSPFDLAGADAWLSELRRRGVCMQLRFAGGGGGGGSPDAPILAGF